MSTSLMKANQANPLEKSQARIIPAKNEPNIPSPGLDRKRTHMYGLDGLRAFAVIAVIGYHLHTGLLPGGLLGVGIFFVISGYLITDILLSQWHEHGRILLPEFWLRRARRLLPGMLAMTAGTMIFLLFSDPSRLAGLRGDITAGLLYISNWWYIFHQVSYFAKFGPPSPFVHFWSLAVETQFYLIWPLLLSSAVLLLKRKGRLLLFITGAAGVSAAAMAILYNPDLDPSRVYYGTDTRAFALLAGAALAVIRPSRKLAPTTAPGKRLWLDITGLTALAVLAYMLVGEGEYAPWLYRGGMVLQAAAAALLVAVIIHPSSRLGCMMGTKPLRWVGERSYGLYLWHYPVIVLTQDGPDTGAVQPVRMLLQLLVTFLLASLSLRYIENPIRRRGFRPVFTSWWRSGKPYRKWGKRGGLTAITILLALAVSRMAATSGKQKETLAAFAPVTGDNPPIVATQGGGSSSTVTAQTYIPYENQPVESSSLPAKTSGPHGGAVPFPVKLDSTAYTIIGDSVLLDAKPYLEQDLPGVYVDGQIGRQMWEVSEILGALEQDNHLGNRVLLELGTNGSFNSKSLNQALDALQDKEQVYLVTVRVPRPWEQTVNKALEDASGRYANVTLIDWYAASKDHEDYFEKDGVHLTKKGAMAFSDLVKLGME